MNENGLTYALDFRAVYWNSRLGTERARLVDSFGPEDVVLDLCCGVGPIALPAARVARAVYANDLNPKSVEYLRANDTRNNAKRGALLAGITCGDARDCVAARASAVVPGPGTGTGTGRARGRGRGNRGRRRGFFLVPIPGITIHAGGAEPAAGKFGSPRLFRRSVRSSRVAAGDAPEDTRVRLLQVGRPRGGRGRGRRRRSGIRTPSGGVGRPHEISPRAVGGAGEVHDVGEFRVAGEGGVRGRETYS